MTYYDEVYRIADIVSESGEDLLDHVRVLVQASPLVQWASLGGYDARVMVVDVLAEVGA